MCSPIATSAVGTSRPGTSVLVASLRQGAGTLDIATLARGTSGRATSRRLRSRRQMFEAGTSAIAISGLGTSEFGTSPRMQRSSTEEGRSRRSSPRSASLARRDAIERGWTARRRSDRTPPAAFCACSRLRAARLSRLGTQRADWLGRRYGAGFASASRWTRRPAQRHSRCALEQSSRNHRTAPSAPSGSPCARGASRASPWIAPRRACRRRGMTQRLPIRINTFSGCDKGTS